MSTRMRSPKYPSTPLPQAIKMIEELFQSERTNSVDREVAAIGLGYSGLTGQSAKMLSNLIQYGLLEKSGKNEVRVSSRAIEILLPDSEESKREALIEAIENPQLFQDIRERFSDGMPSEAALKSYLLKSGFTDAAIIPAARTYLESYEFIQDEVESVRHGHTDREVKESNANQMLALEPPVKHQKIDQHPADSELSTIPVGFDSSGAIRVNTSIRTAGEADRIIGLITALRPFLLEASTSLPGAANTHSTDETEER